MAMPMHIITIGTLVSGAPIWSLTITSAVGLHRANWRKPWEAAFVASSYANILLHFWCLRKLENIQADDLRGRMRLKAAILGVSIDLNFSFCHQVAKLMPPIASAMLWCLALSVATGGLWLFISSRRRRRAHQR